MLIIKDAKTKQVIIASECYPVISGYLSKIEQRKLEQIEQPFKKNIRSSESYVKQLTDQNIQKLKHIKKLEEIQKVGNYISNSCTKDCINICSFEALTTADYLVQYIDQKNLGII